MSIPVLSASSWAEFRGQPTSRGWNETTHLAKVRSQDGRLRDCFVKLLPADTPALLCETLGWIIARHADVACPAFAAILMVPTRELQKYTNLPPQYARMDQYPAWCCELVPGKSLRQIHKWSFFLGNKSTFRSADVKQITAFDEWTNLQDRNYGNIIKTSKRRFVAIDHETLLHELLWRPCGTVYERRSMLDEAEKTLSPSEFKRFKVELVDSAKGHALALKNAWSEIRHVVQMMYGANAQQVERQIFDELSRRAPSEWLANSIGVMA